MSDVVKAKSIFLSAIEEHPQHEWPAFLDRACAEDLALREEVEALLKAHFKLGTFQERTAIDITSTIDTAVITEKPGMKIGRYKLVEEIGQGGMGVVYLAAQSQPVKRNVALKIIKPGMDTREVVARFEAERQALALMDHPHISHVLDGGRTDSGRPYFVMELVEGVPITSFCDENRYSTRQRLELFTQVCQAVQHAHQKGIMHRDIKPSNILVTKTDEGVVPKVIDFGIAKAVHQPLTEQSLHTRATQIIGTPLYMSPEQAQLGAQDIDTRTDVYSLGVVLYELLTGTTPFDKERMDRSGLDEVRRIIREEEPPRPSTRLSTVATALETIAEKHRCDPHTLIKELGGELDWIVMKCLEKDRTRRYESASDLAKDIQRYLTGQEVLACPPSTAYRLRKFTRRNRVAIVTASLIACSMLIGTGASLWQAAKAEEAKTQAIAETEKANAAKAESEANLAAALDAIEKLLKHASDPELNEVPKAQAIRKRMLTDALGFYERFAQSTIASPDVRCSAAATRISLGNAHMDGQERRSARNQFDQAADELRRLVNEYPTDLSYRAQYANALQMQAWMRMWGEQTKTISGTTKTRNDWVEALEILDLYRAELEQLYHQDRPNRKDHQFNILICDSKRANCLREAGQLNQAVTVAESIRNAFDRPPPGTEIYATVAYTRATWQLAEALRVNDPGQAIELFREAVDLGRGMLTHTSQRNVRTEQLIRQYEFSRFLLDQGEFAEAQQLAIESFDRAAQLTEEYPNSSTYAHRLRRACDYVLNCMRSRLNAAEKSGNNDSIRAISTEIDEFIEQLAVNHSIHSPRAVVQSNEPNCVDLLSASISRFPDSCVYLTRRGVIYRDKEEFQLALADFDRAVALLPIHPRYPYPPWMVEPYRERGDLHMMTDDYERAVEDFTAYQQLNPGRSRDSYAYMLRATAYFALGKYTEALEDIERSLDVRPNDLTALTWISPTKIVACPDKDFRTGIIQLADRAVELGEFPAKSRAARAALLIEFGQIERAHKDLSEIGKVDADSHYGVYQAALLALKLDDRVHYRQLCQQLVAAIDENDEANPMYYAAWTAALVPDSLEDYEAAIALAEASVRAAPNTRQFRIGLAAIQMRAGLYGQAVASLERFRELENAFKSSDAHALFFRAMAQHHLGQIALARESLAEATALADQELLDKTKRLAWTRKLTLELLREEAELLLNGDQHNDTKPTYSDD